MKWTENETYVSHDVYEKDGFVTVDRTYYIDSRCGKQDELRYKLRNLLSCLKDGMQFEKQPFSLHLFGRMREEDFAETVEKFHAQAEERRLPLVNGDDRELFLYALQCRNNPVQTEQPRLHDYALPLRLTAGETYLCEDAALPYKKNAVYVCRIYFLYLQNMQSEANLEKWKQLCSLRTRI